jgi:hypothetical protein
MGPAVAFSPSPARFQELRLLGQAPRSDKGGGAAAPSAPAPPTSPQGAGAPFGAAAPAAAVFGLFAVFLAFLLLATPGLCRWLRHLRDLIRPLALQFLLERPG